MRSRETSKFPRPAEANGGLRVRTYGGSEAELALLARVLREGGLVAIPTETVYGLAAHALDPDACRRIFEVKGRPLIDPLIVHVSGPAQADELADVNTFARRLMAAFWPGPLTIVLPRRPLVPDIVTAGLGTVALRCPRHPLARELLRVSGLPLAAPSANPFGYVSPTSAAHVIDGLGGRIGHLLDGGPCEIGIESTIVDLCEPARPVLLRPGAVGPAALGGVLGVEVQTAKAAQAKLPDAPARAPGMLERHYSPRTPLTLFGPGAGDELAHLLKAGGGGRTAVVHFAREGAARSRGCDVFWLSEDGSPEAAARHVFALLRQLDAGDYNAIFCERAPAGELGDAINDRLSRAAAKRQVEGVSGPVPETQGG